MLGNEFSLMVLSVYPTYRLDNCSCFHASSILGEFLLFQFYTLQNVRVGNTVYSLSLHCLRREEDTLTTRHKLLIGHCDIWRRKETRWLMRSAPQSDQIQLRLGYISTCYTTTLLGFQRQEIDSSKS